MTGEGAAGAPGPKFTHGAPSPKPERLGPVLQRLGRANGALPVEVEHPARKSSINGQRSFTLPYLPLLMATAPSTTIQSNAFRMGLLTGAVLVAYTTVAALAGFFHRIEAGSIDLAILVAGSTLAIARLSKAYNGKLPYFEGFSTGIVTSLVASVVLGLGFILLTIIFPHSMDLTQARDLFGFDLSVTLAFLAIVLVGAMTGVITALTAMQYFKKDAPDPMKSDD